MKRYSDREVLFTLTKDNVSKVFSKVQFSAKFVEDNLNQDEDVNFYNQCHAAFGVSLSDVTHGLES